MAWTLHLVPNAKRGELDAVLKDDVLSRQSHKLRDAATAGGPVGETYILIEGSSEAIARADQLLGTVGKKLASQDAESVYQKFREEDEAASAGMGLFFTE